MIELIPVSWSVDGDLDGVRVDLCKQLEGPDLFAVRKGRRCLSVQGDWGYEPPPGQRTNAYLKQTRFVSFQEAAAAVERDVAKGAKPGEGDLPCAGKVLIVRDYGNGSVSRLAVIDLGSAAATKNEVIDWYCSMYDIPKSAVRVSQLPAEVAYKGGNA